MKPCSQETCLKFVGNIKKPDKPFSAQLSCAEKETSNDRIAGTYSPIPFGGKAVVEAKSDERRDTLPKSVSQYNVHDPRPLAGSTFSSPQNYRKMTRDQEARNSLRSKRMNDPSTLPRASMTNQQMVLEPL